MPCYSLLTLFAVVTTAVMLFASERLREVLCLLVTIALCVLFFQLFRRRAWKWTRDPSYVWQLKKKFKRPRFSLRALFVVVTLFGVCFAYVRAQRRTFFLSRGLSLPTARLDHEALREELMALLQPDYESTGQPTFDTGDRLELDYGGHAAFHTSADCEWYLRRLGKAREVYVGVHFGKDELAIWVIGRGARGPFVQSGNVSTEFNRIVLRLRNWTWNKFSMPNFPAGRGPAAEGDER